MILRILGEGQYELSDDAVGELNELDERLIAAVESGDEQAFRPALDALQDRVRALGRPLPYEEIRPSDLVLPPPDVSLEEMRELLGEEGLIPG
jgi:hypothetical protein